MATSIAKPTSNRPQPENEAHASNQEEKVSKVCGLVIVYFLFALGVPLLLRIQTASS
jgi:predicted transcriptional regulator